MNFKITVPATSANLGCGFDVAGLALNLYNEFYFDFDKEGIHFGDDDYDFDHSLTLDIFFETLKKYGACCPKNVHLHTVSNIPPTRGLGSSSTCVVAGILAANHYGKLNLTQDDLALLASEYEGHPDNVVSALFGNLNISLFDHHFFNRNIKVHPDLAFIALIPSHPVKTEEARASLPKAYPISDAIYNLARIPFMEEAFQNKDEALLKEVTQDKLHQQYRQSLIKDFAKIEAIYLTQDIITAWVSGAGPTILLLVDKKKQAEVLFNLQENNPFSLTILGLQIDIKGAIIE